MTLKSNDTFELSLLAGPFFQELQALGSVVRPADPRAYGRAASLKTAAQHWYESIDGALMQAAFDRPVAMRAIGIADGVCRILTVLQWKFGCLISHVGDYVTGVNRKFEFKIGSEHTREHITMVLIVGDNADSCTVKFTQKQYSGAKDLETIDDLANALIKAAMDAMIANPDRLPSLVAEIKPDLYEEPFTNKLATLLVAGFAEAFKL